MSALHVLIVDDELPARERLRALLAEIDSAEVAGEAATGEQALQLATSLSPSVVLLDVRMPGMDGIETAHHLSTLARPPAVIFTTAYDEYAIEAFDAQAIGYLLKPVRKEKLAAALAQAARLTGRELRAVAAAAATRRTHIAARNRDGVRLIPIEEILFFFAEQKYTTVRHAQGEDLIEDSLRTLEEEFGELFVRIHRNALVSTRHLDVIERSGEGQYFVRVRGCEQPLQVSRRMAGELRERFRI
ncbi:MAG TPA: LytTR family DNA-binding domain-containing protein [Steroidobacteraceae bacterium]|nr:LytTR family DNA-binding domain-containing protein [Steroidobacteraceae bacterium]